MSLTKSRTQKVQKQVRDQGSTLADTLADKVGPAVGTAKDRATAARDWAQPRIVDGWNSSLEAAVPRVEAAVEKVSPAVDTARDKLVDDLLPRLVDAVQSTATTAKAASAPAVAAATGAAATGAGVAKSRGGDALAVLKGDAVVKKAKKKKRGRKVLLVLLVVGAGAAAFAAVRGQQKEDPWAAPGAAWTPTLPTNTPTATGPAEGTVGPDSEGPVETTGDDPVNGTDRS